MPTAVRGASESPYVHTGILRENKFVYIPKTRKFIVTIEVWANIPIICYLLVDTFDDKS